MTDTATVKKPRNVVRDAACPKCGKLFYKHALRMHEPWCKSDASKRGGEPVASPRVKPDKGGDAPPATTNKPAASAKSDYWL